MSKKKTAEQLREEARELLRKADELERAEAARIGTEILKLYRANALTLERVTEIVKQIAGE